MQNSKLIDFFKQMDKREFYDFGKFIRCDYFNQRQFVIALYDYIKSIYPNLTSPKLDKEKVFKKLYPSASKFVPRKVNDVMFHLTQLLEEYLLLQEVKKPSRQRQILMANALEAKTMDKYFYKHLNSWEETIEARSIKEPEDYYNLKLINYRRFFYINTDRRNLEETSFEKMLLHFDNYFVAENMRNAFFTATRNQLLNKPIKTEFYETVVNHLQQKPRLNPIFEIYQKMVDLLKVPNHQAFIMVKDLILTNIDLLTSQQEKHEWVTFLNNYINVQISKGHFEYVKLSLNIGKVFIAKGLYHEKGVLNPFYFLNMATLASEFKEEARWLGEFIKQYEKDLPPQNRDNILILAKALLQYCQGKYKEVILNFQNVELEHFGLNLLVRSTKIRCFYELELMRGNYEEVLLSNCEAHLKYVRRQESIPNRIKTSNINFINLVKQLLQLQGQYTNDVLRTNLAEKIKTTQTICRGWLLKKVDEL